MKTSQHGAKGFSLLELMVVIGVMGILVAITVPGIAGHLRTARLKGAVDVLAGDLRYARALSTAQRKTYAVTFAANTYSVVRVSPPGTIRTRELPRGVACSAPDTTKFFAWGLTQAANITVSDHGRSNTVRLLANGSVSHD
jgi:prepilin-type N-terminal cleavage/methylation domain-containing protein